MKYCTASWPSVSCCRGEAGQPAGSQSSNTSRSRSLEALDAQAALRAGVWNHSFLLSFPWPALFPRTLRVYKVSSKNIVIKRTIFTWQVKHPHKEMPEPSSLTHPPLKWARYWSVSIWFCSKLKAVTDLYHVDTQELITWPSIQVRLHLCGLQSEAALGGNDKLTTSQGCLHFKSTLNNNWPASTCNSRGLLLFHTRPPILELGWLGKNTKIINKAEGIQKEESFTAYPHKIVKQNV